MTHLIKNASNSTNLFKENTVSQAFFISDSKALSLFHSSNDTDKVILDALRTFGSLDKVRQCDIARRVGLSLKQVGRRIRYLHDVGQLIQKHTNIKDKTGRTLRDASIYRIHPAIIDHLENTGCSPSEWVLEPRKEYTRILPEVSDGYLELTTQKKPLKTSMVENVLAKSIKERVYLYSSSIVNIHTAPSWPKQKTYQKGDVMKSLFPGLSLSLEEHEVLTSFPEKVLTHASLKFKERPSGPNVFFWILTVCENYVAKGNEINTLKRESSEKFAKAQANGSICQSSNPVRETHSYNKPKVDYSLERRAAQNRLWKKEEAERKAMDRNNHRVAARPKIELTDLQKIRQQQFLALLGKEIVA